MPGVSKGFTLLEIILVLAIIAVLSLGVVPLLQRRGDDIENFINRVNALVEYGRLQAQSTQRVHRILFDLKNEMIQLEAESPAKNPGSPPDYSLVTSGYLSTQFGIPSTIEVRRFLIDGKDEIAGSATTKVWFFIAPDGSSQDILIDFANLDNQERRSYELAPFKIQFRVVE